MTTIKINGLNQTLEDVVRYEMLENADLNTLHAKELQAIADRAYETSDLENEVEELRDTFENSLENIRESLQSLLGHLEADVDGESPLDFIENEKVKARYELACKYLDEMDTALSNYVNDADDDQVFYFTGEE